MKNISKTIEVDMAHLSDYICNVKNKYSHDNRATTRMSNIQERILKMTRPEILEAARKCVCGEREHEYGSPENSFELIAKLWTAYMNVSFTALDVSMMMGLLKMARIKGGTGTDDSFIDLAGYAACGGEIASNPN